MAAGKPVSSPNNLDFIKDRFSRYYSATHAIPPGRLAEREFGFITERGGMWRHLGFKSSAELEAFLIKQGPLHSYYSSAYYSKPNARTMDEKEWLGADLIFDLDADHLKDVENMTMEEMFARVKIQFQKLVHDFLLGDFGFGEKDVKIVFSGGRGYHAHISHDKVLALDSHERREIVDYITKPISNIETLIRREIFDSKEFQGHVTSKYKYSLYPEDTPGWKGKVTASVMDFIDRTEGMPMEEILGLLGSYKGIGDTLAMKIYRSLYPGKPGTRGIDKIRNRLTLEPFSEDSVRNNFIKHVLAENAVDLGGETDEPVTSDIKRLIRLPGSLHGKTGFVVKAMSVDELDGFIPLRDAIWSGFDRASVRVMSSGEHEISLRGNSFIIKKGAEYELPEYAALFFVCQKKCNII